MELRLSARRIQLTPSLWFAFAWLFTLLPGGNIRAAETAWTTLEVPGSWEARSPQWLGNYDGIVWYRTWVKVNSNFFNPAANRTVYEENVSFNIRDLADAHEVYVNGRNIGTGGAFPPGYQSGRDGIHRHKVPPGTLKRDDWNEIAIRVYNHAGPGGFLGEAPFLMSYHTEAILAGVWEFRVGEGYQPGGALKTRPTVSSFDKFQNSNRVLGRSVQLVTGPKLPPAESFAKMGSADDLKTELLLHEPIIGQPVHLSFDERGRLWVTQYRQYPYPAGVKMVSRDKNYRSHYDRVPPPPPNHDRGADIVSIHEDTDGDGTYDKSTVFQDGLNMATAAVRGRGGVWIMQTPYLLFYPDRNFDDIPDGPPEVHLQGFGLEDTHSVSNGLVWGMDGWLYGCTGSTTSSRVTRPGIDPPDAPGVFFEGCMVWRYHPETREYDIFAEGSGNPFGIEVDAQGRMFSGHNGGKTRGWHYVQGGFYVMQGTDPGKFGPPRNPYAFGDLPRMKTLTEVRRFSHFMAVVEGSALPAKYQGKFFNIDPMNNDLVASDRRVVGSTFETEDVGRPLWSKDEAFRPVYIANAPDGSLLIADMYEYYIAHGQHYQSQIDPSTGRIYRLSGKGLPRERDVNLVAKSSSQLVGLLTHPNRWHRQMAARILGERRDPAARRELVALLRHDKGIGALSALSALMQMDALDDSIAEEMLHHAYAPVRMWSVRAFGDRYGVNRGLGLPGRGARREAEIVPAPLMRSLREAARREANPEVRSQMASSARRLRTNQALDLFVVLAGHREDVSDPFVPLMLWWILEAHLPLDRDAVLAVFKEPGIWQQPLIEQHILPRLMRRFSVDGLRQDLVVGAQLLNLAPAPEQVAALMQGFEEAYRGRAVVALPDELLTALAARGQSPLILRLRQGEHGAVQEAMATIRNPKANLPDRILYVRTLGELKVEAAVPVLRALAEGKEPADLQRAALVALMSYDHPDIGRWATDRVSRTSGSIRTATLALAASRASWTLSLLDAIQSGRIGADSVPRNIVDRMRAHKDAATSERVAQIFPVPAASSVTSRQRITAVEAVARQPGGNPYNGRELFLQRCASCHKLFHQGGNLGPDLTHYQRDNLGVMLFSIIDPNAEIREGYQYYTLETKDGRSLGGFVVERDSQVLVLRGMEGENITLNLDEIKGMQPVGRSLMPEGLLDDLKDEQVRDFFAFMRSTQPIAR